MEQSLHNPEGSNDLTATTSSASQNLIPAPPATEYDQLKLFEVSFAKSIINPKLTRIGLDQVVGIIREDEGLKDKMDLIRAIKDKNARRELKGEILPYFTMGVFKDDYRDNDHFESIEFMLFDADGIDELDLVVLRQRLSDDPHIFFHFLSPSGNGVKFAVMLGSTITEVDQYYATYESLVDHFDAAYNITLDRTIDPARPCFFSYDPNLYLNLNSTPMAVTDSEYNDLPLVIIEKEDRELVTTERVVAKPSKREKALQASKGTTSGNRHGDLIKQVGLYIKQGFDEDGTIEAMQGWNLRNSPPHEEEDIVKKVKSAFKSYGKPECLVNTDSALMKQIGVYINLGMDEEFTTEAMLGWNLRYDPHQPEEDIVNKVHNAFQQYSSKFVERKNSYIKQTRTPRGWQETQVTNFVIRTKELLVMPAGDYLTCNIETEKGVIYEDVFLANSDWHSKTKLLNAIGKSDCNFLTSDSDVQPLCKHIIDQVTVRKTGTNMIGLHDDVWVTKDGNIMQTGWAPQQEIVPYGKGSDAFYNKIGYTELNDAEYKVMLNTLYSSLPAINDPNVILPWLGWFMAAPMKERLQKSIGGFPLAFVHGGKGSGKTSEAQMFMRLAGYHELIPFNSTMKPFPMLVLLSSTNGVPLFFDELKKSDMGNQYDQMLRRMREIYVGVAESKGNADQSTNNYTLKAPVAVMGEWSISQPAVKERMIMVSFTNAAINNKGMKRAFVNLMKLPLEGFMPMYIQFCLGEDIMYRYSVAERLVEAVFNSIDVSPRVLKNMTVMVMGLGLWKSYGRKHGITVARIDFKSLLRSQLKEITGNDSGTVQSAVDQLIEGFGEMARNPKGIANGTDYKLDDMKLVIQFNKIFPLFKQYAFHTKFEHDILDGESYMKLFDDTGYVIKKNAQVWWENKQIRSLVIDITKAKAAGVDLEGFGL
jgi:hypothetical protein